MSESDSSQPRRLNDWLGRSAVGRVAGQARALQQQEQRVWPVLARLIDGEWRLARLDADALVLVVESPAYASAVRYRQRQILGEVARATGIKARRLQIKVAPTRARPRPTRQRQMSQEAARHIEAAARSTDAPALREALLRLAKNGKRR